MSTLAWKESDVLGLTPAVDLRRSDKLYAMGGRNFAFTSIGPRSVYGNRFLLPHALGRPEHVQAVRVRARTSDRVFTFTGDAILEWDEAAGGWDVLYVTPDTTIQPYRWTYGYLNGKIYFCHPRVNILVYDLDSGVVTPHSGPGVPTTALAITINNGRLCVIDDLYFSWSWQSDGMNFTPALGEAGQQLISDRVSGFPIQISNYAQGVLIWTTGGVMQSVYTGDQMVYRHRNMNTEFRPMNSFCTLQTDENTCVILDERGLFQSQGLAPEPMAPLFNEFLIEYIRVNKLNLGLNVRIEWDEIRRFMYVMVSTNTTFPIFQKAFVLYPSLDKWGSFNDPMYGILPVGILANQRKFQYYGYVDTSGRVRYWSDFASREILPTDVKLSLRYPVIQKPTQPEDGGGALIGSSSLIFSSEPTSSLSQAAGFYANGSNESAVPSIEGLGALIRIGLIRFDGNDSHDRLSEVLKVMLGNNESGPADPELLDYQTVPPGTADEDYEDLSGGEDLGTDSIDYVNHNLRILSTIDGKTVWQFAVPDLVEVTPAARHYSCSTVGVWHILELSADSPGQAFHLHAFELNATDAGRLG